MSKFRQDVEALLDNAHNYGLVEAVVIGMDEDDEIIILSSASPSTTLNLIAAGEEEVQVLAVNLDRDASDDEDED